MSDVETLRGLASMIETVAPAEAMGRCACTWFPRFTANAQRRSRQAPPEPVAVIVQEVMRCRRTGHAWTASKVIEHLRKEADALDVGSN